MNEPPQALTSMSMHTKRNICAIIKQATSPHYPGSSVSSTEKDIDTRHKKAWTAIDRLSIKGKSDLTDKTQFLPGSGRIDTAIWMHYLDAD